MRAAGRIAFSVLLFCSAGSAANAEPLKPCAWVPEKNSPPVVIVRVDRSGNLYWNGNRMAQVVFAAYLDQAKKPSPAAFLVEPDDKRSRSAQRAMTLIRRKGLVADTACNPYFPHSGSLAR